MYCFELSPGSYTPNTVLYSNAEQLGYSYSIHYCTGTEYIKLETDQEH